MRPRRRFAIVSLRWGRRCCALEEDHGRIADRQGVAVSGMAAFEAEAVESCRSLGIVPADLFRLVSLVDTRLACAKTCREQMQQHRSRSQPYSITSSARASSIGGISSPSAFAVLRLITSSYLVGASTGKSAGFSPLRMRST